MKIYKVIGTKEQLEHEGISDDISGAAGVLTKDFDDGN